MSYNPWLYVYSNPIIYADPTGHKPFSLGYMEGYSLGGGLGQGPFGGDEIVYDYATMTRARFTYEGTLGSPLLASAGLTVYTGEITGFGYELGEVRSKQIIDDYKGATTGGYIGGGIEGPPNGVGVTFGGGFFHAQTSSVRGVFSYLSAGLGLLHGEVVGFESTYDIDPQSLPGDDNGVEFYADASGNVNRGKLISDILTGDHSPILGGWLPDLTAWIGGARTGQVGIILMAAQSFEDFHHDYESYRCIPPGLPFEFPKPTPYPPFSP